MAHKHTLLIAAQWGFLLLLLTVIYSCFSHSEPIVRDLEAERLDKVRRINETAIRATINPDTVEGYDDLETLTADAWILVDDATGCLISERNADRRHYMASLTKMMTCLLALERGNRGDSIEITPDVFVTRDSRVRVGDGYIVEDLISEMMLFSDNNAAYALAKQVGGDTLSFYQMMNEKAAYLRMDSTHFANPNGMPNDSNYSSARDLVTLARYCMQDTTFASIVSTVEQDIPLLDGRHLPCRNTNVLLSTYEGCIGIKTGYTRQAGNCLASAATREGTTLYLILLGSRSHMSRFTESAILLDYGFRVMDAYHAYR